MGGKLVSNRVAFVLERLLKNDVAEEHRERVTELALNELTDNIGVFEDERRPSTRLHSTVYGPLQDLVSTVDRMERDARHLAYYIQEYIPTPADGTDKDEVVQITGRNADLLLWLSERFLNDFGRDSLKEGVKKGGPS